MAVTVSTDLQTAAYNAAQAAANGTKNLAYLHVIQSGIGANYKRVLRRTSGTTTAVWSATCSGLLPISGNTFVVPSVHVQLDIVAADIDTGTWTHRFENASNPLAYIECDVTNSGGAGTMKLSADLTAGGSVITQSNTITSPTFDTVSAAGRSWFQAALEEMRKPGEGASYIDSYATNLGKPFGRNYNGNSSAAYNRALLVQGRYPGDEGFSTTNPDYPYELSWHSTAELNAYRAIDWDRILPWNHVFIAEGAGLDHLPGWVDNTRVVWWDWQCWIKRKDNDTWVQLHGISTSDCYIVACDFSEEDPGSPSKDIRLETSPAGHSVRPVEDANAPTASEGAAYWAVHMWPSNGPLSLEGSPVGGLSNVADVVISAKISLVLHNAGGTDDRSYSQFTCAIGADYYPHPGQSSDYPSVGISRHRIIKAQYPDYEYMVCHTMTEAQLRASNGYPSAFNSAAETYLTGGAAASFPAADDARMIRYQDSGLPFASQPPAVAGTPYPGNVCYPQINTEWWAGTHTLAEVPESGLTFNSILTFDRVADPLNGAKGAYYHRLNSALPLDGGNTCRSQYHSGASLPYNEDTWIAMAIRWNDWPANTTSWFDVHDNNFDVGPYGRVSPHTRSPIWTWILSNGTYEIGVAGSYTPGYSNAQVVITTSYTSSAVSGGSTTPSLWHKFVFRYKITRSLSDGPFLQVWRKIGTGASSQIVNQSGVPIGYYDTPNDNLYPKHGPYQWDLPAANTVCYTKGLFIFRAGAGSPTIDETSLFALLDSKA